MLVISGTTINLTRGDSMTVTVSMTRDGETYTPSEGDSVRFALKKKYTDSIPLVTKTIPVDTLLLQLDPEDTADLGFGDYVYDIEITMADGTVDTFIAEAKFVIRPEVY